MRDAVPKEPSSSRSEAEHVDERLDKARQRTVRSVCAFVVPLAFGLSACAGEPPAPPGLTRTQDRLFPNDTEGTPHGASMLDAPDLGRIFVADTFGGVLAYDGDGSLPTFHAYRPNAEVNCTTLARHAASHTLYCAALDAANIAVFNSDTGEIRTKNDGFQQALGYRSLLVSGDFLYGAKVPSGLDRWAISADGSLGDPISLLGDSLEQLGADGVNLYAASTTLGLVALFDDPSLPNQTTPNDTSLTPIAPLDGPVLRMRIRDGRAAVALGSQGVRVIDLTSGETVANVHPDCTAISADIGPSAGGGKVGRDILAVGCYSGVYTYSLSDERVFGWSRARFGIMDVALSDTGLTALDWWYLDSYVIDPTGFARAVDAPPGYLVAPGGALNLTLRNPGDLPLHVDGLELPAYGAVDLTVDAGNETETLDLKADEGTEDDVTSVVIGRDIHLPGIGASFGIPGMEKRLVYFSSGTCALQWPAMDDLAWLAEHAKLEGGFSPIVVALDGADSAESTTPWVQDGMPAVWSPLEVVSLGAVLPGKPSYDTFSEDFDPGRLIPGGDEEAQYWVDGDGKVRWFERVYRGAERP